MDDPVKENKSYNILKKYFRLDYLGICSLSLIIFFSFLKIDFRIQNLDLQSICLEIDWKIYKIKTQTNRSIENYTFRRRNLV